jgi:hypothetical protein
VVLKKAGCIHTRCDYKVPGIIYFQGYLNTAYWRGHLESTPLEQLCFWPNDAATVGKSFGVPIAE